MTWEGAKAVPVAVAATMVVEEGAATALAGVAAERAAVEAAGRV